MSPFDHPSRVRSFPWPFTGDSYRYSANVEPAPKRRCTVTGAWGGTILDLDNQYEAELAERHAILQRDSSRFVELPHVNRLATGTPYRRAKRTPGEHPFVRAPAEPILPSRPMHWMSRRAERRSRTAAVQRPPAGLVLAG